MWIETHQDKAAEFLALDERLSLRKGLVDVKEILHVAGILGWASGLFPWFAAFNSALWAAIVKHGESQDAKRKKLNASQRRANGLSLALCHTHHNCVTLDQVYFMFFTKVVAHSRQNPFKIPSSLHRRLSLRHGMHPLPYRCAAFLVGPRHR